MKEMKRNEIRRYYTFIGVLGIMALVFLMLVNIAGAEPYAYIGGTVLDISTKQVITRIPSVGPVLAITPDGKKAYTCNSGYQDHIGNTVSVIDTSTNKVLTNITVGNGPQRAAITPDGSKVYVTNWYDDNVSVIDTASDTLIASIKVIDAPNGIAITGNKAYVANSFSEPGAVSVIDTTTDKVVNTVILNKYYPFGIATSSDGKKVYVTDIGSSTVSVIDTTNDTVTANISVNFGGEASEIAVRGSKAYVTSSIYGTVYVINTTNNLVEDSIYVGGYPCGVSFTPNGSQVYVTGCNDGLIDVIDQATNSIIDTIPIGGCFIVFKEVNNTLSPVLPVANFSVNTTEGYAPLNVQFNDLSTNATSVNWYFGDGNNSTATNPMHTYFIVGNYTVNLTVSNENGTGSKLATINVTEKPVLPIAAFTASPTLGNSPLNVTFTDKSTGSPTAWEWVFGDGTNSTAHNATHNYPKAGNYTVALTVSNAAGSNKTTKTNYIKVTTAIHQPTAILTADPISGNVPLKVKFTDKSTGSPTSWKWSFGDGAYSTVKNPTYTYNGAGKYNVSLTVKNAAGSNKTTKINYIKVTTLKVPVAVFSASPASGKAPLNVQFTDKSTNNPTSWKWSFGDGATKTSQNPIHTYSKAGSYTVKLTATNAAGSNTATKASYIYVVPVPVAAFTASPTSGKHPLNIKFTDKSTGSPISWYWNFGDKSTSTVRSPTHKYTKAGKYTVKLTVKNAAGSITKTMVITVK